MRVKIDDITAGYWREGTYRFCPHSSYDGAWTVVPRVGETILDGNEFTYKVVRVVWYGSDTVRLDVERSRE
jgi:hypothetical protein